MRHEQMWPIYILIADRRQPDSRSTLGTSSTAAAAAAAAAAALQSLLGLANAGIPQMQCGSDVRH
jgi:cytochrome c-type biogenesis protein CcmH/NrfG